MTEIIGMTEIIEVKALRDGVSERFEMTAGAAEMSVRAGQDERFCLLVHNGDTAKAVGILVKAGDGIRARVGDLLATVEAGKMGIIQLDSMRFKQLSGENKGKFLIQLLKSDGSAAFDGTIASVKLAAFYL